MLNTHSLGLQTEKHLALYQSKHLLIYSLSLSLYLSILTILLIDGMKENAAAHTETHKSCLLGIWNSNRHETAQAPSEQDMRGMARDEGKSFIQEEQGNSQKARWPFRAAWMGFSP